MVLNLKNEGIFFLHISFLDEASKGVIKGGVTDQLQMLMKLIFHDPKQNIQIISCDRTLNKIASKRVEFAPGILSIINEKSYYDGEINDDDLYSLKIASREKIALLPSFFIVSEAKKKQLSDLARSLGYKINVLSIEDFK